MRAATPSPNKHYFHFAPYEASQSFERRERAIQRFARYSDLCRCVLKLALDRDAAASQPGTEPEISGATVYGTERVTPSTTLIAAAQLNDVTNRIADENRYRTAFAETDRSLRLARLQFGPGSPTEI